MPHASSEHDAGSRQREMSAAISMGCASSSSGALRSAMSCGGLDLELGERGANGPRGLREGPAGQSMMVWRSRR